MIEEVFGLSSSTLLMCGNRILLDLKLVGYQTSHCNPPKSVNASWQAKLS